MERITKRDFLKLSSYVLIGLGFGGLIKWVGKGRQFLRPPGAFSEAHFRSLCLSCGKCEEVCPQNVIRPVLLEEDPSCPGTPQLDFSDNYCNLCMKCIQVCPTGALMPIRQKEVLLGIAKVLPERCVRWLGKSCGGGCLNRCPFKAVRVDRNDRPVVVEDLCIGCGICELGCSLSANEIYTKGIVVYPVDKMVRG